MKFYVTWAIAKVLERKRRARGYSLNKILDLIEAGPPEHGISRSSVERIFRGEYSTTEDTFNSLIQAVGLDRQWVLAEADKLINWLKVCRDKFTNQPPLSISHLLSGAGFAQQRESVYFAPDLILRSQPVHHSRSEPHPVPTKQITSSQRLSLKQFKKAVLQPHIDKETRPPARVVLLGEAGVGKTMLLQDIAAWVFADESRGVAIQVFLTRLELGETIKDYLFNRWLKQALSKHTVSEADCQQLAELLQEKTVWLLIDGVDEVAQNGHDLLKLTEQLREVSTQVNIVLTCRLSIWELESNSLRTEFRTSYQIQLLDSGTDQSLGQIGKFIKQYLSKSLAHQLIEKLREPEHTATITLVKNPLMLTLLCYTCQRWRELDGLLETKARLYEKFVEYLYNTKPDLAAPNGFQQHRFNQALGILAFRALDETNSPYRLTRSFVQQVWREADLDPEQLSFVEKIGFLSEIGVAQEVPDERVYAFLHPSLQEYFAAVVTDRYELLFDPNSTQSSAHTTVDRVLQQRWRGTYLFWIGSTSVGKLQKESLLQAMIDRDNYCNDYYYHSAVCIAAEGIAEFRDSRFGDVIVQQVVDWSLTGWNPDERPRDCHSIPKTGMAERTLPLSDPERVIAYLSQQLQVSQSNIDRSYCIAVRLASLEQGKALIMPELIRLLHFGHELIYDHMTQILSDLTPVHTELREYFTIYLKVDPAPIEQLIVTDLLYKISCINPCLVEILIALNEESRSNEVRRFAARLLNKSGSKRSYAVPDSTVEIQEGVDESSSISNEQAANWLEQLELRGESKESRRMVIQLCEWLSDDQNLVALIEEGQAIQLVRVLQKWLDLSSNQLTFEFFLCNNALYHCAQFVPHTVFCQGWRKIKSSS